LFGDSGFAEAVEYGLKLGEIRRVLAHGRPECASACDGKDRVKRETGLDHGVRLVESTELCEGGAQLKMFYEKSYSMRGLYAKLVEDAALYPDTMDERRGAWGRSLALFRLIHGGHRSHFVQARGGKLFNPDAFPFTSFACDSFRDGSKSRSSA
jgi:hypothetical protein